MSDKYLNIDLNDPRSAAIAEVMSNKTCKKIIELLAEKEMSESDIASALGLPLNTVGYNIGKLLKVGLVDKSKTFFWSVKGKKIPTYRLSNKKILISPKRMLSAAPLAMIGVIIGAVLIIALIASQYNVQQGVQGNNGTEAFKKFSSDVELKNYIKDHSDSQNDITDYFGGAMPTTTGAANAAEMKSDTRADSYSQTNVQVEGVDEPDIVKNDGKYIYTVNGNRVVIVDAYPASGMKNLSAIEFSSSVQGIFVNGDKLIVFGNGYGNPIAYGNDGIGIAEDAKMAATSIVAPCRYGGCGGNGQFSEIYIYDISDRSAPKLENNISVEGNYVAARMIGDYVYLVASKYAYYDDYLPPVYVMDGIESKTLASDVLYYPGYEDKRFTFTTIFALNLDNDKTNEKVYLTGATSSTVYVSENNIYLTYTKFLSEKDHADRLISEAIIPILPAELKNKANEIMDSGISIDEKYRKIVSLTQEYSFSLSGKEKEDFDSALKKSMSDVEQKISKEYEKTIIMQIGVDGNDIGFEASGEVLGHLLNQFAMDEFDDNLRVATTTGQTWGGESSNHVFVLGKNLKLLGSVEDIAPGESIYSVRFIGNRAYLVTFKQVDPFFVIDLSNPEKPKILGYLKIPGYSQYLHPYDENHVIGIGKDVNESIDADKVHSSNAVYYTAIGGVKISIFDVSDVSAPKETAKISIGDRGSGSYALTDHKAFLFDKSRNLLVIPITVSELRDFNYTYGNYREPVQVWQGAYVFNVTSNNIGFRGRITHIENQSTDSYQIYDYKYQVQRSLFMDNTLYTISSSMIKANNLDDMNEINKLKLGYNDQYYPGSIMY